MSKAETTFRKTITRFGELPGILVPLGIIGGLFIRSDYQIRNTIINNLSQITSFNQDSLRAVILGFGGIFLSYSIGTVVKYFYYKPRPIPRDTSTLWKRINAGSMPSIHASNGLITASALVMAVFALPINLDLYPRAMLAAYGCIILGFFYYLSIALSRIALQKHYPIDVLAGTILGTMISVGLLLSSDRIILIIKNIISYIV